MSEFLILLGVISLVVGLARGSSAGGPGIIVGVALCTVAVLEVTVREHFRGYRSHSMFLAFLTMIALHTAIALGSGGSAARSPLLLALDALVFLSLLVLLSRSFDRARARARGQRQG